MKIDREHLRAFTAFRFEGTTAHARSRGDHRSSLRGRGTEFADYRAYDAGDDVRQIDWNVYFRLGTAVVRQRYEERSVSLRVWLDVSHSMGFGSPSKADLAAQLAAGLALCASIHRDPLMLTCFGGEKPLAPMRVANRDGLDKVLAWLRELEPSGRGDAHDQLARTLDHHRADETIIISDLLMEDEPLRKFLRLAAASSVRVVVLHVVSDAELDPILSHIGRARDSESGEEVDVDGSAQGMQRYRDILGKWLAAVEAACRSVHATYVRIDTRRPIGDLLRQELPRARVVVPAVSGAS